VCGGAISKSRIVYTNFRASSRTTAHSGPSSTPLIASRHREMFWPSIAGIGTSFGGIRIAVRISRNLRRFFWIISQKIANAGSTRGWQRTFPRILRSDSSPIPTGRKHRVYKRESAAGSTYGAFVSPSLFLSARCQPFQVTEPQCPEIQSFQTASARKEVESRVSTCAWYSEVSPYLPRLGGVSQDCDRATKAGSSISECLGKCTSNRVSPANHAGFRRQMLERGEETDVSPSLRETRIINKTITLLPS